MTTFEELKQDLCGVDEITLLELFNLDSSDLVSHFSDYIYDNQDKLRSYIYGDEDTEQ